MEPNTDFGPQPMAGDAKSIKRPLFVFYSAAHGLGIVIFSATAAQLVTECRISDNVSAKDGSMKEDQPPAQTNEEVLETFKILSGGLDFRWGPVSSNQEETRALCTKAGLMPHDVGKHVPDLLPASLLTVDYDIRHQIYGHFFVMNKAVYLTELYPEMFHMELEHASTARSFNRGHPRDGGHSLMLTCRQLNNEITELFYGTNCFVVQPGQKKFSPRCMSVRSYHFLPDLRQSTMRMLTRVELILGPCIDWRAITAIQKTATTISDLQNLKIRIYSSKKGDGESRRDENDLIVDACKLILGARGSNDRDLWQIRGVGSDFDGLSRALQCEIPALEILAPDQKLRNLYRWLRD